MTDCQETELFWSPSPEIKARRLLRSTVRLDAQEDFESEKLVIITSLIFRGMLPSAGFGVVRIDPLRFLAGCRIRRLNQV